MKKIMMLLLAAGSFFMAQAQSSRSEARKTVLGRSNGRVITTQQSRTVVVGRTTGSYPAPRRTYPYRAHPTYRYERPKYRHEHHDNGKHKGWYKHRD